MVDGLKVLDPKRPIREADMERTFRDFRVGPEAEVALGLLDDLVGAGEQRGRHVKAHCLGRFQVDDKFVPGRSLYG